jgi:tetratricopeptide (TPR) repeat protein
MKFEKFVILLAVSLGSAPLISAQINNLPAPTPTPKKQITEPQTSSVPRERREQAIAKLLEGQRYLWSSRNLRTQTGITGGTRMAKTAFQKAVELDPSLAEGYTALAELSISAPPTDIEEAIMLASLAAKIEPNNFGAHRILSRLYTFKSKLNNGILDPTFTQKAIEQWKKITELDPRNAEGWAFLSEFYDKTNKPEERITALRNWISSAAPLETQFYMRVMGGRENLSPESASLKLAGALKKGGKTREAVEILSQLVADEPENVEAVELLRESVESADNASAMIAVESLQKAVYANPANTTLIALLAQVQARGGKIDEAAKVLRDASNRLTDSDKIASANLQISLGDLYADAKRVNESAQAYQTALTIRGIENSEPATDDQREFAVAVFEKLIRLYKNANRPNDAKSVIERARKVLGKDDLFADRQLITFFRETGKKSEALQTIRGIRTRFPDDYGFLNLEATLLTENGKVDEAVGLVKNLIEKKKIKTVTNIGIGEGTGQGNSIGSVQMTDDFSNYLFISNLYSQAGRGKEAIEAANLAYTIAQGAERKQIAKLTLATAQQMSGDFLGAETTLREILKQMPDNPIALNNLGYFLVERNIKFEEALEMIQKAVNVDPTNPSYLDSLGWVNFKLGKYAEAEKSLKEALRYDSSATILEHLGDVYQKQNKPDDAKTTWQKALNLASDAKDIARLKSKLK